MSGLIVGRVDIIAAEYSIKRNPNHGEWMHKTSFEPLIDLGRENKRLRSELRQSVTLKKYHEMRKRAECAESLLSDVKCMLDAMLKIRNGDEFGGIMLKDDCYDQF